MNNYYVFFLDIITFRSSIICNILVTRSLARAISTIQPPSVHQRQNKVPAPRHRAAPRRRAQHRSTIAVNSVGRGRRDSINVAVQTDAIADAMSDRRDSVDFGVQTDMSSADEIPNRRDSVDFGVQTDTPTSVDAIEESETEIWCVCRGEDDGRKMIMCESNQCLIKWFHFDCMRLKTEPKNDWFCANCALVAP